MAIKLPVVHKFIQNSKPMPTNDNFELLTHDELLDAIENDITSNYFKTSARLLMSAITDWPTPLQEPKELINELRREIKDKLVFDNIELYSRKLQPRKEAWKMEAITSLLGMFDFEKNKYIDRTIELEALVERLTQHYRQKNIR